MFDWLRRLLLGTPSTPTTRRRGRGPGLTPEQRWEREKLRWVRQLARENPAEYDRIMAQRVGLAARAEQDPLKVTVQTLKGLREAGLVDDPRRAGDDDWKRDLLKTVVAVLPTAAQAIAQAQAQAQAQQAQQAPAALPTVSVVPQPAPEPLPAAPRAALPPQGDHDMSLVSRYLISQLENRSPEEAAMWLLQQTHPSARELVQRLIQTPDDQIPALLAAIAQEPSVAPFVSWLRARPDWLMDTIHAIRQRAGGTAAPRPPAGTDPSRYVGM